MIQVILDLLNFSINLKNSLLVMVKMEQDFGGYKKNFGNFGVEFIREMSTL